MKLLPLSIRLFLGTKKRGNVVVVWCSSCWWWWGGVKKERQVRKTYNTLVVEENNGWRVYKRMRCMMRGWKTHTHRLLLIFLPLPLYINISSSLPSFVYSSSFLRRGWWFDFSLLIIFCFGSQKKASNSYLFSHFIFFFWGQTWRKLSWIHFILLCFAVWVYIFASSS